MEPDRLRFYPNYGQVYQLLLRTRKKDKTEDVNVGKGVYVGVRNIRSIYGGKFYVFLFRDNGNLLVYDAPFVHKFNDSKDNLSLSLGTRRVKIPEKEKDLADKILKMRGL